jgi:cobalt-zinc-cadmium efflux system outer membrane protein
MNLSRILVLTLTLPIIVHAAEALSSPAVSPASADASDHSGPVARASAKITLVDVLARTAEANPELLALGLGQQAADGRVDQASMGPNPSLSLSVENFGGTRLARGSDLMEVTIEASQLIERGGKSARRVALAERAREVDQASFALRKSELMAFSAGAFAKVLAEKSRLVLAAEQLAIAESALVSADRRLQSSAASPSEVARARAALASAQAEYRRAQSASFASRSSLAACWGGTASDIDDVEGDLRLPVAPPSLDRFQSALAVAGSPRLALRTAVLAGQRAAAELESARGVADVTLGAGVRRLNEGPATAFIVGASFPLMVRDDNSGSVRAARALVKAAEQSLRAAETELRADLASAHAELLAAHEQATALRREALPAAEAACASVQAAYDKGVLPLIDVLDARRGLVALRRELLEAELAYVSALIRAEALVGVPFFETKALLERR